MEEDLGGEDFCKDKENSINNWVFVMDEGLRALPLAALHDGEKKEFIIQKGCSIGYTPSMSVINTSATQHNDLKRC